MAYKTFVVEISEHLSRLVRVKARTDIEAERKVEKKYRNSEIVLDWQDFDDYEIKTVDIAE